MVSRSVWEHEEGSPLSLFRESLAILFLQKTENRFTLLCIKHKLWNP